MPGGLTTEPEEMVGTWLEESSEEYPEFKGGSWEGRSAYDPLTYSHQDDQNLKQKQEISPGPRGVLDREISQ